MSDIIPVIKINEENLRSVVSELRRRSGFDSKLYDSVSRIVEDVRTKGDNALIKYAREFENPNINIENLRVKEEEINKAYCRLDKRIKRALYFSYKQLKSVQQKILRVECSSFNLNGVKISAKLRPISSVGCYIPGGIAAYPSSVIMTAGLAKIAGVPRIIVCTPSSKDRDVSDAILAAAKIVGIDEVYRVGGAHSIAAMAYGTETISPVSKIVGPGGKYVSIAKYIVSANVSIDFLAGPTEIAVFADESCPPDIAGWELIGQAEHGKDSICLLVTTSEEYALKVREKIKEMIPNLERKELVENSLQNSIFAVCNNIQTAVNFIQAFAPEHLEILTKNKERVSNEITSSGLKLVGLYSPCSLTDYVAGTDHVIPTNGLAGSESPLSILDFVKLDISVKCSRKGLVDMLDYIEAISQIEQLPNHFLSAKCRFE